MLIIPDRYTPKTQVLAPMHKRDWYASQRRAPNHGIEDKIFWGLWAYDRAGSNAWVGMFEDREDVDAFMAALVKGTLRSQKRLWSLCTPHWEPQLARDLIYDLKCEHALTAWTDEVQEWIVPKDILLPSAFHPLFLEGEYLFWTPSGAGANQYFTSGTSDTVPSDWGNVSNTIRCIGGGGSGGKGHRTSVTCASGAGGGAYAAASNTTLAPGATVNYQIGAGGTALANALSQVSGNDGTATFFNGTAGAGNNTCQAGPGIKGIFSGSSPGAGGAGGTVVNGSGNSGGQGGSATASAASATGSGAGGAGGPDGAGNNGTNATSGTSSAGGAGNANTNGGGAGGSSGGGTGSAGTTFSAAPNYGPGGGGGGNRVAGVSAGGAAGNYGAGSGGACATNSSNTSTAAGAQGLAVVAYTPALKPGGFNMPMLGM